FGPSSPVIPGPTLNDTSETDTTAPNQRETWVTSIGAGEWELGVVGSAGTVPGAGGTGCWVIGMAPAAWSGALVTFNLRAQGRQTQATRTRPAIRPAGRERCR